MWVGGSAGVCTTERVGAFASWHGAASSGQATFCSERCLSTQHVKRLCLDTCLDMRLGLCSDMRLGLGLDTCLDMCLDMCLDVRLDALLDE